MWCPPTALISPPGRWGAQDAQLRMRPIFLATGDVVAAVQTTGEGDDKKSQVLLGPLNGETTTALERRTLSRPSLEYDASAFWTVLDGTTIARVSRSSATGECRKSRWIKTPSVTPRAPFLCCGCHIPVSGWP